MSDQTGVLPTFDRLRSALTYDFERIQREADPFKRLAWLIERQETYYRQIGKETKIPNLLGLPDRSALLAGCEEVLRNYYEMLRDPQFPRTLIREGLERQVCGLFLDVMGQEEKGEQDYGFSIEGEQAVEEIERWLGFRAAGLTTPLSTCGLATTLDSFRQARSRLVDPRLSRADIVGQVAEAFVLSETLLCQLLSFYGRVFCGPGYLETILEQGGTEAARQRRKMRKAQGWNFLDYTQLLHVLDRLVTDSCKVERDDERDQRFIRLFGRRNLFPPPGKSERMVAAPVRRGNRIVIEERGDRVGDVSDAVWILRCLNALRPLYVHRTDGLFIELSNLQNFRDGAQKILDAFVGLWSSMESEVFPRIVILRRLLQVQPEVVRLDYVPENSYSVAHVRVAALNLPPETSHLLGREAYLYSRSDTEEEDTPVIALCAVQE